MDLRVDDEFKNLLHPLTTEQYNLLEKGIIEEGCRDALVVWNDTIVDGHNRYEICTKHGIGFRVEQKEFENREAALDWIDFNQIGRRNLTKEDFQEVVGRRYNRMKKTKAESGTIGGLSKGQNDTCLSTTAEKIASEHNISPATVKRHGKFAEAIEEVKKESPEMPRKEVQKKAKQKMKKKKTKKEVVKMECATIDGKNSVTLNKKEIEFMELFGKFLSTIKKNKELKWKQVRYEIVCRCIGDLNNQI